MKQKYIMSTSKISAQLTLLSSKIYLRETKGKSTFILLSALLQFPVCRDELVLAILTFQVVYLKSVSYRKKFLTLTIFYDILLHVD